MKWFLFAMYITSVGNVDNWKEPEPFDTLGECSKELMKVRTELYEDHPEIFKNRVLICDEVAEKDVEVANAHFFKQFGEVPFR